MSQKVWQPPKPGRLLEPAPLPKNDSASSRVARSPYPAWFTSTFMLVSMPMCVKNRVGFPHLVQLPLFSLIFAGSGYMIHSGDPVNGAGTTTAWSLTFLLLNAKAAFKSRRAAPIALALTTVSQATLYGYEYFFNTA